MAFVNTRRMGQDDIVVGVPPSDFNSDQAGDYVSLKHWSGVRVIITKAAGTAGDDISLQMYQATDVAGTSEKALTFDRFWAKVGLQTGIGVFTQYILTTASGDVDTVSVAANGTTTDLAADSVQATFVIDIPADTLDVTNGFDCVCFKNDGADLGNSCYGTVIYELYGARQAGNVPLSSIVD